MSSPLVYAVVLTFNVRAVAERCFESLRTLTYPNLRVLVVDNGSTDGTEAMARSQFPEYGVIQTGANLGYTGGNNRGIEHALKNGADYVLILNPDTVVANARFIEEMVDFMEAQSAVGIAGPRVFLREPGVVQNTVLHPPGLVRSLSHWLRYRMSPDSFMQSGSEVVDAETLNGVCLLIRASCLGEIGLFDENIFMYIEDADLDYRARRAGWRVCYLPIDSVVHEQKVDGYHMTSQVSFLLRRNSVYFLRKIGRDLDAWGYALGSLVLMLARGVVKIGRLREYAQFCRRLAAAYWQILSGRPLGKAFGPPFG
jgi:GT2 family glycosyltransferase